MGAAGRSKPEREWNTQRWHCAGVAVALVVWIAEVLAHPTVPFMVRWAFFPFFMILVPVFIRDTVRKWRANRTLTQ